MKLLSLITRPLLLFILLALCPLSHAETSTNHRILISGCGLGQIAIVGINQEIEWSYPIADEVSDAVLLPNGNILHSVKTEGIQEIKPNYTSGKGAEIIWKWTAPLLDGKRGEVHTCQPLPNQKILIGESHDNKSFIREIDRKTGNTLKTIELPNLGSAHSTFRQIRKTNAGTYLVTQQQNGGKALEFDSSGKLIRSFPDGRYVALRLPNGNTLIACGDAHRIIEVSPDHQIVWEVKQNDLPNISLGFVAGLQRLPNGNTILCNWGGHGNTKGPAVLEITPDKKVIWSIAPSIPNKVSSIQILDPKIKIETPVR
ncbi:MAG: hypothetical protein RRY13_04130 [Akkermansia sp.]